MKTAINYKLIVLWLITVVGMILHSNYHTNGFIYEVDVVKKGANGVLPNGLIIIRNVFYHLPIVWILLLMYTNKTLVNLALFVVSIVFSGAHLAHFSGEFKKEHLDFSQIPLLFIMFVISILIVVEQYKHWKTNKV
ncbi:MAG TPA: hypothetical protein PLP27_02910 [Crocinitomicaceae bacterium]|nr:hypothetical protein [Crocinitomicaceae bacterium]